MANYNVLGWDATNGRLKQSGSGDTLVIPGNLQVDGTTTTVNSTTIQLDDKNIELANGVGDDAAVNNGGITLISSDGNKTFNWVNTPDAWTSSEHLNVALGKVYKINNTEVLSSSTLGSGVTSSSLTSVGTITSGTWQGTAIGDTYISSAATWNAKQDALTFGIADGNAVDIDSGASIANNDYAKFSSTGLIGQTYAEVQADLSVDDLITLSGVSEGAANLGTFTGTTIADNQTVKQALQALETSIEGVSGAAGTHKLNVNANSSSGVSQGDILILDSSGNATAANNNNEMYILGVASANAAANDPVYVYDEGQVLEIGTIDGTTNTPAIGKPVYLAATGNGANLTCDPPTTGMVIRMGYVAATGTGTSKIFYKVEFVMSN